MSMRECLQGLQARPWCAAAGSILLHLALFFGASPLLIQAPVLSLNPGSGGAAGPARPVPLSAEVWLESPAPPDTVSRSVVPEEENTVIVPDPEPPPVATPRPEKRPAQSTPATGEEATRGAGGVRTVPRPQFHLNTPPPYPEQARRQRQEGVVLLRLSITADGSVQEVSVQRSSGHPLLDRAAMKAAQRYRFQPATLGGLPVPSTTLQPIRFDLRQAN
ncbi:MAG: TonB family protein [Candidatus Methylacidiphilales bacterium]|nr:TonB family protein [Candidatus Methylacidiphilales bacterium]